MFSLMSSGKINLVITSTLDSQSVEGDRMFRLVLTDFLGFVHALINCITLFSGFNLFIQMAVQTISARSDRTAIGNVLLQVLLGSCSEYVLKSLDHCIMDIIQIPFYSIYKTSMPVPAIFSSLDNLYDNSVLIFVTLNSSIKLLNGICRTVV